LALFDSGIANANSVIIPIATSSPTKIRRLVTLRLSVGSVVLLRCFIMTEKIWHGFWWLPGHEHRRIAGTLHVQDSGDTRLTLIGGFDVQKADRTPVNDNNTRGSRTILGQSESVKITLVGGYPSLWHGSAISPDYQEVRGSRVLVGAHVQLSNDPVFSSVSLTLENFGTFLVRHAFDRTAESKEQSNSVVYRPEDKIEFSADTWNFQVYTYFPGFQTRDRRGFGAVDGVTSEVLIATSAIPRPLTDFDEIATLFTDLLTLASGEACGVIGMSLDLAEDDAAVYPPGDARSYRVVQVYGSRTHTAEPNSPLHQPGRFRFTCSDLSFEALTRAWIPLRRRARAATNLLFGLYYIRRGFTETRLLSAAVVAESLHSALFDIQRRWSKTEFKSIRAAISEGLSDSEQLRWVEDRIKNETSFKEKLIQLAALPDQEAVAAIVGDSQDWARKLVDARNGLAHTGADTNKSGDIFDLAEVTLFVASLALMQELGLPGDVQRKAFQRSEYLSVIRHN
jgi:hypothetical protein